MADIASSILLVSTIPFLLPVTLFFEMINKKSNFASLDDMHETMCDWLDMFHQDGDADVMAKGYIFKPIVRRCLIIVDVLYYRFYNKIIVYQKFKTDPHNTHIVIELRRTFTHHPTMYSYTHIKEAKEFLDDDYKLCIQKRSSKILRLDG